jgi:hypothetical protein
MTMLNRRGLLAGMIGGIVCAPAIVRASSLMPVKAFKPLTLNKFDMAALKHDWIVELNGIWYKTEIFDERTLKLTTKIYDLVKPEPHVIINDPGFWSGDGTGRHISIEVL